MIFSSDNLQTFVKVVWHIKTIDSMTPKFKIYFGEIKKFKKIMALSFSKLYLVTEKNYGFIRFSPIVLLIQVSTVKDC